MFLDTTLKSLELVLGSAQTTTAMSITVDYVDLTSTTTTTGANDTQSNGTSTVTILAAPAASTTRKINGITIYNADSISKIVTVRLNNNSTLRILVSATLNVGDTLGYTDTEGWYTQDTNGNRKITSSTLSTSITLKTPVASTSGTAILFTGIPSFAKRVTVNFSGVGTSGTGFKLIQIGSGSVTSSGYLGAGSGFSTVVATSNFTTGFGINSGTAADRLHGTCTLTLENSSTNTWIASGVMAASNAAGMQTIAGSVSLAGSLDRVNITTSNGTDTFAAGEINITYE